MPEKGGLGPPRPAPVSPATAQTSQVAQTPSAKAVAPLKAKVAPPQPAAAAARPLVIPTITWTSAPPPIPPRSFSTPAPPPPTPEIATERPPENTPEAVPLPPPVPAETADARDARARAEDLRRAHDLREEARALLQQTLEEALAPLHFAVRDLERRLAALEAVPRVAPPPVQAAPAPVPVIARPLGLLPPPAIAAPVPVVAPPPRAPSFDLGETPFDGSRRRRRVVGLFVMFLVIVFGALLGTLVSSWMEPR